MIIPVDPCSELFLRTGAIAISIVVRRSAVYSRRNPLGADMWAGIGEVRAAQADGSPPTTLAAGSAPGESGVSVLRARFHGGMHFEATPQRHCVCFQMPELRVERRMAGRAVRREAPAGELAICPAGFDCAADVEESVDG